MADENMLPAKSGTIGMTRQGIQIETMEDAFRFAKAYFDSGMAPQGFKSPQAVLIAMQMGAELGLPWSASVQNIAVINGRPSVWGDAALAVCQEHPKFEDIDEYYEAEDTVAVCELRVKGKSRPVIRKFSVDDARKAGLWGKQGPWSQYPKRMLQMRARSWALKDAFPGALKGLYTQEEAQDMPDPRKVVESEVVAPDPGKSRMDAFVQQYEAKQVEQAPEHTPEPEPEVTPPSRDEENRLIVKIGDAMEARGLTAADYDGLVASLGLADFNLDTADVDTLSLVLDAVRAWTPPAPEAAQQEDEQPEPDEPPAYYHEDSLPFGDEPVEAKPVQKPAPTPTPAPAPKVEPDAVDKQRQRTIAAVMGTKTAKKVAGRDWNKMLVDVGRTDYKIEICTNEQLEKLLDALEALA